jgi:FMN reductase [NAD(P)H]
MENAYREQVEQRFPGQIATGQGIDGSPLIRQVLGRKSVRRYTDLVPSDELLDLVVAAALSASAKSDFQQASVLRVTDPKRREAIGALFPAMPWIAKAPVFYIFLGDARRLERIGEMRGKAIVNGTLEGFFNASIDAALVMQTFILAAESVGLGCCPISVIRNRIDEVASIYALPDKVFPVAGLCVGYPADSGHISMRLPRTVTVHHDCYHEDGLQQRIDEYDRARDSRHAIARDQQRAPERFGYADFYGWSEDKARQAASPEGAAFPVYLRAHGFTLD